MPVTDKAISYRLPISTAMGEPVTNLNLQLLCPTCNSQKRDVYMKEEKAYRRVMGYPLYDSPVFISDWIRNSPDLRPALLQG